MSHKIQTATSLIFLLDPGILHFVSVDNATETLADAKENIAAGVTVSEGKRVPCLIDLRKIRSMDRAARAYYAGTETAANHLAAALLVDAPIARVLGNFFMGLNKPIVPTRLFNDEGAALAWLASFL